MRLHSLIQQLNMESKAKLILKKLSLDRSLESWLENGLMGSHLSFKLGFDLKVDKSIIWKYNLSRTKTPSPPLTCEKFLIHCQRQPLCSPCLILRQPVSSEAPPEKIIKQRQLRGRLHLCSPGWKPKVVQFGLECCQSHRAAFGGRQFICPFRTAEVVIIPER